MKSGLDSRIARAVQLTETYPSAASILGFYRELAAFQKSVSEDVQANAVTDALALTSHFAPLLELLRRIGPQPNRRLRTRSPHEHSRSGGTPDGILGKRRAE